MQKRKNNLKEMERRVQLNTSNSTAPASSDRNRELKEFKVAKEVKEDKEVKEMEIELSER